MKEGMVSYLITSYNHSQYITQTIDSIVNQTYSNVEILVCDDCSSDDSDKILSEYSKAGIIKYYRNENNMGATYSANRLLELAQGEYIGIIASDDWISPLKIERQVEALNKQKVDAIFSPIFKYFEETDEYVEMKDNEVEEIIKRGDLLEYFYHTGKNAGLIQAGLFRSKPAKEIKYLENYKADDVLFQLRFLQAGFSIGYLNEPLTFYRIHNKNTHKNFLYCIETIELPVYRDFVPQKYQAGLMANSYQNAALNFYHSKALFKGLKYQNISLSYDFNMLRIKIMVKGFISCLMKKMHVYGLYYLLRHHTRLTENE